MSSPLIILKHVAYLNQYPLVSRVGVSGIWFWYGFMVRFSLSRLPAWWLAANTKFHESLIYTHSGGFKDWKWIHFRFLSYRLVSDWLLHLHVKVAKIELFAFWRYERETQLMIIQGGDVCPISAGCVCKNQIMPNRTYSVSFVQFICAS